VAHLISFSYPKKVPDTGSFTASAVTALGNGENGQRGEISSGVGPGGEPIHPKVGKDIEKEEEGRQENVERVRAQKQQNPIQEETSLNRTEASGERGRY